MTHARLCLLAAVAAVLLVCWPLPAAHGQSQPVECDAAQSMTFNETLMSGVWYEIARYPAPAQSYMCVLVNLTVQPNMTLDVGITYSNTPSYPWVNQTMYAAIPAESPSGYNLTFWNPPNWTPPTVFKLLSTDYTSYALVCGYRNASDMSTYFGVILMREQDPEASELDEIEAQASEQYAQFPNGSMPLITQDSCAFVEDSTGAGPRATFNGLLLLLVCAVLARR